MARSRRAVSLAAALLVVGIAVAALVRSLVSNADEIGGALHRANWWWVGAAAVLSLVSVPLLAERWRAALGMLGETMPLDVAVRLHYGEVACAVETDPLTAEGKPELVIAFQDATDRKSVV